MTQVTLERFLKDKASEIRKQASEPDDNTLWGIANELESVMLEMEHNRIMWEQQIPLR